MDFKIPAFIQRSQNPSNPFAVISKKWEKRKNERRELRNLSQDVHERVSYWAAKHLNDDCFFSLQNPMWCWWTIKQIPNLHKRKKHNSSYWKHVQHEFQLEAREIFLHQYTCTARFLRPNNCLSYSKFSSWKANDEVDITISKIQVIIFLFLQTWYTALTPTFLYLLESSGDSPAAIISVQEQR